MSEQLAPSSRRNKMDTTFIKETGRTLAFKHAGRMHEPKTRVGLTFTNPDGQPFVVFKETVLDALPGQTKSPEAVFRVRFHVKHFSFWQQMLIAFKSPLFVTLPGFRSKLWMKNEATCDYQGVYEWDSLDDAQAYVDSESMKIMRWLAIPDGIQWEIYAGGKIKNVGGRLAIA
jgi:hypothetical protein